MIRTVAAAVMVLAVLEGGAWAEDGPAERDPWQGFNRAIFTFNDGVDRWVLEPVAKGWDFITPHFVQRGVSNFFQNLRVPIQGVNGLLQGKPLDGASDVGRFVVNTTLGIAGFVDVASQFKLVRHDEDFGQTLGVWGVPNGPYLVLPLLGPSTLRDTGGLAGDAAMTPTWYFVDGFITVSARVADSINARSLVLKEVQDSRGAAVDFYSFVRNAYLQRRDALVRDGTETTRETDDNLYFPSETLE